MRKGVSDFAALRAAIEWEPNGLVMFGFDLLFLDGADLRRLPLVERGRSCAPSGACRSESRPQMAKPHHKLYHSGLQTFGTCSETLFRREHLCDG